MIVHNYSLLKHNTFGIDAVADCFVEYDSEEELLTLIAEKTISEPFIHIGSGSNMLFVNKRYEGTVLHSAIKEIEVTYEDLTSVCVRAGAGVVWDDFVAMCVEKEWYGAENLSAIPGETGSAAVQNIGAYGVEAKDLIKSVEIIDITGAQRIYRAEECCYGYRNSLFKRKEMKGVFVTFVNFCLSKKKTFRLDYGAVRHSLPNGEKVTLRDVRETIIAIRHSKLPDYKKQGNAGSFFMNPIVTREVWKKLCVEHGDIPHYDVDDHNVKIPAGWLIEQCGWKGKTLGRAAVHDKQALVIVNMGGADGSDIVRIASAVSSDVKSHFGIDLKAEVNYI